MSAAISPLVRPWRALALTVVPLMLGIHVTMSWSYESRNSMHALPVLAVLLVNALAPSQRLPAPESESAHAIADRRPSPCP